MEIENNDSINHPNHYTKGGIDFIEVIWLIEKEIRRIEND